MKKRPWPAAKPAARFREKEREGMILVMTTWIILVLAGTLLVFARQVISASRSASEKASILQAEWTARAALAWAGHLVDMARDESGAPVAPPEGDEYYRAVPVGKGFFWILRASAETHGTPGFGLADESARLNLNEAGHEMILKLPGMTTELAAALVDWRNPAGASMPGGAGDEYYLLRDPPYLTKSGPLETVEEILLLRGGDPVTLFGESDNGPEPGFYESVTVHSTEEGVERSGADSLNPNNASLRVLTSLFSRSAADRIIAERERRPFRNIFDFYFRSGLDRESFDQVAADLEFGRQGRRSGLININSAPVEVLACLPGLEEADAEALAAARNRESSDRHNLAWVADILPPEKAVAAGDWLTTRSWQFSADILALSADGRVFRRYRAILDRRQSPPRILSWQETTALGWPLEPLDSAVPGRQLTPGTVSSLAVKTGGR